MNWHIGFLEIEFDGNVLNMEGRVVVPEAVAKQRFGGAGRMDGTTSLVRPGGEQIVSNINSP